MNADRPRDISVPHVTLDMLREALVLVDHRREVVFMNAVAQRLLGKQAIGRNLAVCLRHPTLIDLVDKALASGQAADGEMTLTWPVERTFSIHVSARDTAATGREVAVMLSEMSDQRRLEQTRQEFVANVSHELRSPLASLVGFIETLQGPARDDPEAQKRFLAIMQNEAGRMSRLIDDLLTLNRVELGEHIQPQGRVSIAPLLATVQDSLEPQLRHRAITLEIEAAPDIAPIVGDEDEIRQVLRNLIDNAVKYSREHSVIRVTVSNVARIPDRGGAGVCICVIDQGAGIPLSHLPRLTERFYRVDKGRARGMGGTGLGLAIVKHIINRHRGRLAIRSEINQGSTFTVYLPAAPT